MLFISSYLKNDIDFNERISFSIWQIKSSFSALSSYNTLSRSCQSFSNTHGIGCLLVESMSHTDLLYYFGSVLILISTQVNGIVGSARRELCFLNINIMLPLLVAGQPQLPQAQQATQQLPQDSKRPTGSGSSFSDCPRATPPLTTLGRLLRASLRSFLVLASSLAVSSRSRSQRRC